jgi:hypothetical protein
MTIDRFESTFRVQIDRTTAWHRLTEQTADEPDGRHVWLPGFDGRATVVEEEPERRLATTKDGEPCAGTDIVVTLDDDDTGTRIHVVQSRFGDWLGEHHDMMAVGWRFIVADLQLYLATGVHARRHLRTWGDLGADAHGTDGGVRVTAVRPDGPADRWGLADGDLLVDLAGAPIASLDDLVTVLRVIETSGQPVGAAWIRDGSLVTAST